LQLSNASVQPASTVCNPAVKSESGRVTAAPGSVPPELGCTPINGPIDDKQSVDLDGAVHVCVCLCTHKRTCKQLTALLTTV